MPSKPVSDLTVVIPTLDRPAMVRTALASVLGQEPAAPAAVVIVDDGSDPAVAGEIAALERPGVRVLRNERPGGVAAARNRGLAEAETTWVAFLDDDDVWAPDHVDGILRVAGDADLVYSGYVLTDERHVPITVRRPHPPATVRRALLGRNRIGTPSCVVLRTATAKALGGFDEAFSITADWDMWLRVLDGGRAAAAPQLSVGYMAHPGSMQAAPEPVIEEIERLAAKHRVTLPDGSFPGYVATRYADRGDALAAARWYLRGARRNRSVIEAARAGIALVAPRAVGALQTQVNRRRLRADGAELAWLERLRSAELGGGDP